MKGVIEGDQLPPPSTVSASDPEERPLPPPNKPSNIMPEQVDAPKYSMMTRRGSGSSGRRIPLLSNHFKVSVNCPNETFYQYSVSFASEDTKAIESKGIGRKIMEKLYQTYSSELARKHLAYDGEKTLYTVGPLPQNNFEFTVVLEETSAKRIDGSPGADGSPSRSEKKFKRSFRSKTFTVRISYAAKIPLKSIQLALKGSEVDNTQDALRVLDIVLRLQAASRGCLLVRQSFHNDTRNFTSVGGGVTGCRGFHSSFRTTRVVYP